MSRFKSHEEYDAWRSQKALKRQGAKDLEKLDAERPVYMAGKGASTGLLGYPSLALVGIVGALYFTAAGREFLGKIVTLLSRLLG